MIQCHIITSIRWRVESSSPSTNSRDDNQQQHEDLNQRKYIPQPDSTPSRKRVDEGCDCRCSNRKAPDRAVGHWGVGSLESTDPKDQTVSCHVSKNNICSREHTSDEEYGFSLGAVCRPGENIL
jgi:hypothetical protein